MIIKELIRNFDSDFVVIIVVGIYLIFTTGFGFFQIKKVKTSESLTKNKLNAYQAATFLLGFTLGGTTTYGVAGDTIKFGLTYLIWFPISIAIGSWVTGFIFARDYHKLQGITLPAFLQLRFDNKTRYAAVISNMIYCLFVFVIEIFTLSMLFLSIFPGITLTLAAIISLLVCVLTSAFSGILGASKTNVIHSLMIIGAFFLSFMVLFKSQGSYSRAFTQMQQLLSALPSEGITFAEWISPIGLGWGVVGQILLAKVGRLGGISSVSNITASCETEEEAVRAFVYAGFLSAIIAFLSSSIGIFTAAYLGEKIIDIPVYSAIGIALKDINVFIASFFFAALSAAIISTYGPTSVSFASVFVEDILMKVVKISKPVSRWYYTLPIIIVSVLCTLYVIIIGIEHIMPFVFATAFPSTIPTTIVLLFGIKSKATSKRGAFWAIVSGVVVSLTWGLALNNPFGIPNIIVALFLPLAILVIDLLINKHYLPAKPINPIKEE